MEYIYIISILIGGLLIVYQLVTYMIRLYNIRKKNLFMLRLGKIDMIDYFYLFLGFILIGIGVHVQILSSEIQLQFVLYGTMGIAAIIKVLVHMGEYVLIDSKGIQNSKYLQWQMINQTMMNQNNPNKIVFKSGENSLNIDFGSTEKLEEFKGIVKQINQGFFEKHLNNL